MKPASLEAALMERKKRRSDNDWRRNEAREERWARDRYAVPYRTDRPAVTLGVLWFCLIVDAIVISQWLVAIVAAGVAGIAGLQTGHAWAKHVPSDRRAACVLAGVGALSGLAGTFGLGLGCVVLSVAALGYSLSSADGEGMASGHSSKLGEAVDFAGTLVRSSIPVGLAGGSLVALTGRGTGAAISLIILVSAYEIGDYLVGTGSANMVEGPVAGVAVLAVAGAGLVLTQPLPFDGPKALSFSILTAICCPLGQIAGSAVLPRGDAWSPGLRRLDSLLINGPLWLILL